ncbi:thiolase family protein [Faecalibacter rhinopitheci]|uniref:Acetyl-CoA C-acyltransferase n=1 Tax=Faecalibacter rhinopitheci TaxID=2779678 RepID=A0A8J7K3M2_9FLAO|nr:acetyl-CoA C-acyltransferase [Faecalibacter rhinopitheci]MBF0596344.1 acetyl-CoA C-acyltransferase [Faecalibacter rhinopitheci]
MKEVVIVSAVRTAMGSFLGSLSNVPATDLGATAIKGALNKINLDPKLVDEVYMGNVLQANEGQAPAKQAMIKAGIPNTVPATTVNKVCASGMKAVMFATQAIRLGDADVVVAGGMENMSMVPFYSPSARSGNKYGNTVLLDGIVADGLQDAYSKEMMGTCGDATAKKYNVTREQQDEFAINSYNKSAAAWETGKFENEIVPVEIPQRKGEPVIFKEDEEYKNVNFDKVPGLRAVFSKDGTVTAANASTINDGASALVLMSLDKANELGLKPLAKVTAYADAAHEPEWFTTAPAKAVEKVLTKANLNKSDVDFWEFNEAFSVVGIVNTQLLGLDAEKVNVNGGAVSLGHPLGNSGSRILVTLLNVLEQNGAKYGGAAICNGGGGASAMIIEKL